jgi:hypothetical protein
MKKDDFCILVRLLIALTITGLYYYNVNKISGAFDLFKEHIEFNLIIEHHPIELSTNPVDKSE